MHMDVPYRMYTHTTMEEDHTYQADSPTDNTLVHAYEHIVIQITSITNNIYWKF